MEYRRTIPYFLFFVICSLLPAGESEFYVSPSISGGSGFTKSSLYETGISARFEAGIGLGFGSRQSGSTILVAPSLNLAFSGSSRSTVVSDIVVYRAFSSVRLSADVDVLIPGTVYGVSSSIGANYARYNDTGIFFFFPDLTLCPHAGFFLLSGGRDRLDIGIPIRVSFRRDPKFDLSVGVSFAWNLFLF
jgi:hypothetical protein